MKPKKLTQKETDEICAIENDLMVKAIIESETHWEDFENGETNDERKRNF